jgi:hypothetical protein
MRRAMFMGCVVALMAGRFGMAAEPAIPEELAEARQEYAAANEKLKKTVAEHFTKREDDARRRGAKPLVDAVERERQWFEKTGRLPASAPKAVRDRNAAVRQKLEVAYRSAIRAATKEKHDQLAEQLEQKLIEFRLESFDFDGAWQCSQNTGWNGVRTIQGSEGRDVIGGVVGQDVLTWEIKGTMLTVRWPDGVWSEMLEVHPDRPDVLDGKTQDGGTCRWNRKQR